MNTKQRTVVVTGSASGMGAATKARLEADGQRVIGIDVRDADVIADLGTTDGRQAAIDAVAERSAGQIDGVATWAGVPGLTNEPADRVVSVNYFGTVVLLEGLLPLLAAGDEPAAVVCSSGAATCFPGIPDDVMERCLASDEAGARDAANTAGGVLTYPATKMALARWVRRQAPREPWAGAGVTLNAVAPGMVDTPMLDAATSDPAMHASKDAPPNPLKRMASPAELAGVARFLLGPDARFVVGAVLTVDGGSESQMRADDFPSAFVVG